MSKTQNIINKGVHCKIRVYGSGLVAGTNYTAVLYYSPSKEEGRADVTQTAATEQQEIDGVTTSVVACVFDFTPEQTAQLMKGKVIFEVYDTENREQMMYDENYATVRSTSLQN